MSPVYASARKSFQPLHFSATLYLVIRDPWICSGWKSQFQSLHWFQLVQKSDGVELWFMLLSFFVPLDSLI